MHKRGKSMMRITFLLLLVAVGSLTAVSIVQAQADVTPPVVTSVTPADGSTIYTNGSSTVFYQLGNATPLVIKADYNDGVGGSGVDPNTVMVHLDGGNMLGDCPIQTDAHVECNATAADLFVGSHTLDVYVGDMAGLLTMHRTTVIVTADTAAPTYSNLLPVSGSIIYTSQLNSTGINDLTALRFDYDIADAAPSSGYSPMSHVNDSMPPGVMGAMISNTSCVKTPATNPTHYSCQVNRASLLHLGDNTLSVLLKDKVGNSNYSDPSSVNHYTVVDDVKPAVSGITADPVTISASYSDPLPTGALSANLASGINSGTAMVHVDGMMIMSGCTATATGISCPTPAGLSAGPHTIEVIVDDNAGNRGTGTLSYTPPCTPARPDLSTTTKYAFWGSYADYTARNLSVKLVVNNRGTVQAYSVAITGSTNTNGVTLSTATPIAISDLAAGVSAETVVIYHVPVGVTSFVANLTGSASDVCGTGYTYPV